MFTSGSEREERIFRLPKSRNDFGLLSPNSDCLRRVVGDFSGGALESGHFRKNFAHGITLATTERRHGQTAAYFCLRGLLFDITENKRIRPQRFRSRLSATAIRGVSAAEGAGSRATVTRCLRENSEPRGSARLGCLPVVEFSQNSVCAGEAFAVDAGGLSVPQPHGAAWIFSRAVLERVPGSPCGRDSSDRLSSPAIFR